MNDEQLAVIRHGSGPLQVLAQAGAGKTRAAVHRVARLVVEEGVAGERILMVTFSRKAANEMDARVRQLGVSGVSCQTWNAFCYRILREDRTPYATWTIDDKDKAKNLVKQAAGYKHVDWKGADITKIRSFIGRCKASLIGTEDVEEAIGLAREMGWGLGDAQKALNVYATSQRLIEEALLLTFDDQIVFAYRHLLDEENRANWAAKFDYVVTDEAQDNNVAQVRLQEMLARDHRNLMVVGDLAQAIYGFRGSDPQFLADFESKWSAARVAMCRNYRSGAAIVRAANDIIRPATMRQPEDMVAARGGDEGRVEVVEAEMLEDEAAEVAAMVKRELAGGRKGGEITILFRLNAQSRALEDAFLRERLPYRIVGGTNFYERKEVKDLLGYLRVAAGLDHEGDGVKRSINAPFRFLGAKFVERLMAYDRGGLQWPPVVEAVARQEGIQRRQVESAQAWAALVRGLGCEIVEGARPSALLDALVKKTAYIQWLEKEEGEESIESSHAANVRELLRVAEKFGTVAELLGYIDANVRESAKMARQKEGGEAVTMMSIHRSKGLEWPIVWVVGCNDEVLPHRKGDPEEERRLAYVAATRARDVLYLSYVRQMATRVGLRPMLRSPFLDGIGTSAETAPDVHDEDESLPEDVEKQMIAAGVLESAISGEPVLVESCFLHGEFEGETCPLCVRLARLAEGAQGLDRSTG